MSEDIRVHKCGDDWVYCDGKCDSCIRNNRSASDRTKKGAN